MFHLNLSIEGSAEWAAHPRVRVVAAIGGKPARARREPVRAHVSRGTTTRPVRMATTRLGVRRCGIPLCAFVAAAGMSAKDEGARSEGGSRGRCGSGGIDEFV